ncbi:MAG: NAD(P)H-hydrate epimerase / ADP-dependent (S)-NAD(P)H-hydrate dehydratase, partial [uncultured Solirubrobacteraceae bacterium]
MSWADWLAPLPDAATMRAIDAWAIEERGIPGLDLMDRAGEALAAITGEAIPAGRIAVVCGRGNNGGDGLVAARALRGAGRDVDVLLISEPGELSLDAAEQLRRLGGPAAARPWSSEGLAGAAGAIDALLGTGFHG